jgi:hypothetical protein
MKAMKSQRKAKALKPLSARKPPEPRLEMRVQREETDERMPNKAFHVTPSLATLAQRA